MAVKYVVAENTNEKSSANGKFYGKAKMIGTTNLKKLAQKIQQMTTATEGDVMVVLTALVAVMKDELANSMRVKLDGFGTFKIGLKSTGAVTHKAFSAANIVGTKVLFQPEMHIEQNGTRTKDLLQGIRVEEYDVYQPE